MSDYDLVKRGKLKLKGSKHKWDCSQSSFVLRDTDLVRT